MAKNQAEGVFVPKKQVRKDLLKLMEEDVRQDIQDLSN
jgi:hypothetical protein